jgi:UDP-N-acetylglucosamine:LPS N-acetylglucosamine transferase
MTTRRGLFLITNRGGHLHNALMLTRQMRISPDVIVVTEGPEVPHLRRQHPLVLVIPGLFTWLGKKRLLNPASSFLQCAMTLAIVGRYRPRAVISLGASDVVFFCYWARLFGAEIYHVECMNQVTSPSITGRVLYPICKSLYVQWEGLLNRYGPKATYKGWVL